MPSGKVFKYNPQADVVSDRTASQIEAAKRKAVGGKKKRCIKGKSCSATCISASKLCLVDIPWVAARGIGKVRDSLLKGLGTNLPKVKEVGLAPVKLPARLKISPDDKEDIKSLKSNYNTTRDIIASQIKEGTLKDPYGRLAMVLRAKRKFIQGENNPTLNKILNGREAEGKEFEEVNSKLLSAERLLREKVILSEMVKIRLSKMPNSTPREKAARDKMQKFLDETRDLNKFLFGEVKKVLDEKKELKLALSGTKPKATTQSALNLPEITTYGDFIKAKVNSYKQNNPKVDAFHKKLTGILSNDPDEKFKAEREKIINSVGGITKFYKGVEALRDFTKEHNYSEMRAVQRKKDSGKTLTAQEEKTFQRVKDAERLLAVLPKDEVVKFRGVPASREKLNMIRAAADGKLEHAEGALASWSTHLGIAKSFADKAGEHDLPHRVIYRTINKRGSSIAGISEYSDEDEVTTSGSAKYRHTGNYQSFKDPSGHTYHIFDIEEL